jgi:hypothetical protein
MTKLLKKAFSEASELPEADQDKLAEWLLAELASERRWENAYSSSADQLAELAREAVDELEAGDTEELDPERL